MQDFTSLCSHPSENRNANHPSSVSDLYVKITVPKDFDSTLYHSLSWHPDTDTDDGSYDPHNSHSEDPLIQNQNTSRGCKTCGHRYIRHVTPTAARQASKSISVNAYEMRYTGKPCTTL